MFNKNKKTETENTTQTNKSSNNGTKINKHRKNHTDSTTSAMNMISERSEIIGTLKSRRDIRIAGKVDGGVEAEGKIIVESTGFIDGSINSEEAHIDGRVEGDIRVSDKLTLAKSANVKSDIYVNNFCMEEGAIFNGTCHMNEKESTEKSTTEKWTSASNENNTEAHADVDDSKDLNEDQDEDEKKVAI